MSTVDFEERWPLDKEGVARLLDEWNRKCDAMPPDTTLREMVDAHGHPPGSMAWTWVRLAAYIRRALGLLADAITDKEQGR